LINLVDSTTGSWKLIDIVEHQKDLGE